MALSKSKLKTRRGVSLVELIVVVGIIALFASLSVPRLLKAKYNLELKGAARTVASALLAAKTISLKEGAVAVDLSDSSAIKLCYDNNKDGACSDAERIIQAFPLDTGIHISFENSVYFERGLPRNPEGGFGADTIQLIHNKTAKCLAVIYSRTGRVRINEC